MLVQFGVSGYHNNVYTFFFALLSQTFDRDEPTRDKEVYLTVRATDNGNPHLDDVCTIKVTIQDENDNSPVFDKVVSILFAVSCLATYYGIVRDIILT